MGILSDIVGGVAGGPVTAIAKTVDDVVNAIWPNQTQEDKAKFAMLSAQLTERFKLTLAQIQVNNSEAQSKSLFIAGWRPAVGWICALSFGWQFIGAPIAQFIYVAHTGHVLALPTLDNSQLDKLLYGLLGLGVYRTAEKITRKNV